MARVAGVPESRKPVIGSYLPMRFGSRNDYRIATTELIWLREKQKGNLSELDFASVGTKYSFPPGFLKEGLKGQTYPRDDLIAENEWYPILYSWIMREKLQRNELFRLQIDYWSTRFRSNEIYILAVTTALYAAVSLYLFLSFTATQVALTIGVPAALALTGLFFQLRSDVHQRGIKLEEYVDQLKREGLGKIVEEHEKVLAENMNFVNYAGKILLRKLQEGPSLTVIPMGVEEQEIEQRRTRLARLLRRRGARKREKVPVFWAENPFLEYRKRIMALFHMDPNKDDEKDTPKDSENEPSTKPRPSPGT